MPLHRNIFTIQPTNIPTLPQLDYQDRESFKSIGRVLWKSVDMELFEAVYKECGRNILPIVIKSDVPEILNLPWELLYNDKHGFLAHNKEFTLSRDIPSSPRLENSPKAEPLRILFFSTLPDELESTGRLAVEHEQEMVLKMLLPAIKEGKVILTMPNDGRFDSFKYYLENEDPHMVFLSGHSGYSNGIGKFLFEDNYGKKKLVDEEILASAFTGTTVECVVLSSCQSAQAGNVTLNSGLVRALAFKGIKNVIGMSDSIYDETGQVFAKYFVKTFMPLKNSKTSLAQSVQVARENMIEIEGKDHHANRLLKDDWFLPLLFCQDVHRSLVDWDFKPENTKRELISQQLDQIKFKSTFIGRRYEFRTFYNTLHDGDLNRWLIYGEGGIGKTAMVVKCAKELEHEGYKVFDISFNDKDNLRWQKFINALKSSIPLEKQQYLQTLFNDFSTDPYYVATEVAKYLVAEHKKVTFVFDNLESIQSMDDKTLTDTEVSAWIKALSEVEDVILLLTSRWSLPHWSAEECLQLLKPKKGDYLYYISRQNMDFTDTKRIDLLYKELGGNYRGTEYFFNALRDMTPEEENKFLAQLVKVGDDTLSDVKNQLQTNMAIKQIFNHRTEEEISLLEQLTVYKLAVPLEGVEAIAEDINIESLKTLVSFSLVEESFNSEYKVSEYQVSTMVLDFITQKGVRLSSHTKIAAASYLQNLFANSRPRYPYIMYAHQALLFANKQEEADRFALDRMVGHLSLMGNYRLLIDVILPKIVVSENKEIRATALGQLGKQYLHISDYTTALEYLTTSLAIWQEIGDKSGEGATLNNISQIYDAQGDYTTALEYLTKSLAIRQEIGDKSGEGATLNNISQIYKARGDYTTSLEYLTKSLAIQQEIGDKTGEGATLNNIATASLTQGDYTTALEYLTKSLAIRQEIGDKSGMGATLFNMGHIAWEGEKNNEALKYWVEVNTIANEIGNAQALAALDGLAKQLSDVLNIPYTETFWDDVAVMLDK